MSERTSTAAPPPDDSPRALRRVAELIVAEAAEHLRGLPRPWEASGDGVTTKSTPTDVVTASDDALETLIRGRLAELRAGDAVVGEEQGGRARAAEVARADDSGVIWVVDPIDGTVNFLYGLPWYAISLAAVRDGVSVAGAVIEPASGRLWSAAAGGGATCDGRRLAVSTASELGLSMLATGFSYSAERRGRQVRMISGMLPHVRDLRRAGSAALDLCAVAAGWVDGYLEHGSNWWDWAAAALIAAEAGAVVRVPGPTGTTPPDDGLGADAVLAAAPGIAGALTELAERYGAASV